MARRKYTGPMVIALLTIGVFFSRLYSQTFHFDESRETRQKILIIFTQTRSGSSFAGEIFAATRQSLYLYEPLYPFGLDCIPFKVSKQALLGNLLSCDFKNLRNIYSAGFNKSHWTDGAQCENHGICFSDASSGLLKSYSKKCNNGSLRFQPTSTTCGYPLREDILKNICELSSLIVTKVTRLCTIAEIEDLYVRLKRNKKDVYIVHLVRDLRYVPLSPAAFTLVTVCLLSLINRQNVTWVFV